MAGLNPEIALAGLWQRLENQRRIGALRDIDLYLARAVCRWSLQEKPMDEPRAASVLGNPLAPGQQGDLFAESTFPVPADQGSPTDPKADPLEDLEALALATTLVSHLAGAGHICADLADFAGRPLPFDGRLGAPVLPLWQARLARSPACFKVGHDTPARRGAQPLILDGHRLYLHRHWQAEVAVATDFLARRAIFQAAPMVQAASLGAGENSPAPGDLAAAIQARIAALFAQAPAEAASQREAVAKAAVSGVALISGGPGTGKTTTLAALLAVILDLQVLQPSPPLGVTAGSGAGSEESSLRIVLAAPTGKAAARMEEAVRQARQRLPMAPALAARLPDQARTLHRLLGLRPDGTAQYHADHPLDVDLLVIDEASMVDLPLMDKVLRALPATARLVLLGDRDQLASVEAGAVFADLCAAAEQGGALAGGFAPLRHSFRFGGAIGRLALAIRDGDADAVSAQLRGLPPLEQRGPASTLAPKTAEAAPDPGPDAAEIRWSPPARSALLEAMAAGYQPYLDRVAAGAPPAELHEAFAAFRVLLAHRQGPWGVEGLNGAFTRHLGIGRTAAAAWSQRWYPGRPVLVTANDYALGLFNGDIGLTAFDPASGELKVWFETSDANGATTLRPVSPQRLGACETAWAMTVHKSQGSEFAHVLLALPDQASPLMTRELVYTGVTRAKSRLSLMAEPDLLAQAITRRIRRYSALAERLGARFEMAGGNEWGTPPVFPRGQ